MKKVAVVIVTYNRKDCLRKCLKALFIQSLKPVAIYVIDNNSNDGTYQMLNDEGLLSNDVPVIYVNSGKNIGGAGGFHLGLKMAHETGKYDAYLLMDDDGCPDVNEVKELVPYLDEYNFVNAFVINIDDESRTSFSFSKKTGYDRKKTELEGNDAGLIIGYANPFNGTCISKTLVEKVGYPKAEMFIYGDEINFLHRCKKCKFNPVTVTRAIHRHPAAKTSSTYLNFLGLKIPYTINDNNLLTYCRFRNQIYNVSSLKSFIKIFLVDIVSLYYYRKKSKEGARVVLSAIWAGIKHDFTGHLQYVK